MFLYYSCRDIKLPEYGMKTTVLVICMHFITATALLKNYRKFEETSNELKKLSNLYSDISHLYSIGNSVEGGRELYVIALGKYAKKHQYLIPDVKYIGNIHGNEIVSKEILLELANFLLSSYSTNTTIGLLLNKTRIHIMPTMNPDGMEKSISNMELHSCTGVGGRYNSNKEDLNRNFPDKIVPKSQSNLQPETRNVILSIMKWLETEKFVLSANFHGGALVVSYPYDSYPNAIDNGPSKEYLTPDNDIFTHLSRVYANSLPVSKADFKCNSFENFDEGITNGAAWYPIVGGMQDYNYIVHKTFELTIEMSCCKFPNASDLPSLWQRHKNSLIIFLQKSHIGIKGTVFEENTKLPIDGAKIFVNYRSTYVETSKLGEYWRLLLPGTYIIKVCIKD
ncbi:DgyrCDS9639 [Dimorphilus gyrociliatus]|uniref:DgyrCDS9639 n=1 Tax=Dimorphilus gyrociliatus TaxID=2664684 RepID=A0A7I8VZ80_9ANNE|nr:DgyrCDS9639 [Dimorphilus gyrociliatus]